MALSIDPVVKDRGRRAAAIKRLRDVGGRLPTWSQLAAPQQRGSGDLSGVGPDDADPRNLWRGHWFNGPDRTTMVDPPGHIVLPRSEGRRVGEEGGRRGWPGARQ